jgi:transketolase N-terminal domain/subunit
MAEITSVLFFNVMRYEPKNPRNPAADRFVLSKVNTEFVLGFSILNYFLYFRVIVLLFYMLHGLKLVHFQ